MLLTIAAAAAATATGLRIVVIVNILFNFQLIFTANAHSFFLLVHQCFLVLVGSRIVCYEMISLNFS